MSELILGDLGELSPASRRIVASVTVAFTAMLFLGAFLFPPLSIPDERFHLDMVVAVMEGGGWPDPGSREISDGVEVAGRLLRENDLTAEEALLGRAAHDPHAHPACVGRPKPTCSRAPTLEDLDEDLDVGSPINSATQHPPLYYSLVGSLTVLITGLAPFPGAVAVDELIAVMRIISACFLVPLPLLIFLLARSVVGEGSARIATLVPLAVPGLMHRVGPSLNNDGLLISLTAAVLLFLVRMGRRRLSKLEQVALGIVLGLALLTKGLAITLPVGVLIAAVIGIRRRNEGLSRTVFMLLRVGAVSFIAGGWWWVRNLLVFGELQPRVQRIFRVDAQPLEELPMWASQWVVSFSRSFVGDWFVLPGFQPWWAWALLVISIVLIATGSVRWPDRPVLATIGVPVVLAILLVLVVSAEIFLTSGLVKAAQGRYGYVAIPILATTMAIGLMSVLNGRERFSGFAVMVSAVALQVGAIVAMLRRLWAEESQSIGVGWDAVLAWSPFTEATIWVLAVAVVASWSWAAWSCTRLSAERSDLWYP